MQYLLKKTTKLSQKKPIFHKNMSKATKNRINVLIHASNRREELSNPLQKYSPFGNPITRFEFALFNHGLMTKTTILLANILTIQVPQRRDIVIPYEST